MRERLDVLLVERGLVITRAQARAAVLAGEITVDGCMVDKPGTQIGDAATIEAAARRRYVSRGGDKLDTALTRLGVDVTGEDVLDLGASTGGFVDRLLQGGAARVIAVDVGYGQLDWKLRGDPRVTVLERTNARQLTAERLPFVPSFVTADLSELLRSGTGMPAPDRSARPPGTRRYCTARRSVVSPSWQRRWQGAVGRVGYGVPVTIRRICQIRRICRIRRIGRTAPRTRRGVPAAVAG